LLKIRCFSAVNRENQTETGSQVTASTTIIVIYQCFIGWFAKHRLARHEAYDSIHPNPDQTALRRTTTQGENCNPCNRFKVLPIYRAGQGQVLACVMLMGAAAAWAISIVFVRSHRFTVSAFALAPWQTLVAAGLLFPLAILVEGSPPTIGESGVASLVYVGPVATAFAYWAVVEAGRHFRASTMSMTLLAAPSLGILISALTLGEPIGASLIAGVVLTGTGIRLATSATQGGRVEPSAVREN
jgi:hypothetical protein